MSLVQELADLLRSTRDVLPVAEVAGAAERLRTAGGLLAWVMHQSSQSLPDLGDASSHLDHAAAALRVAQDALDDYCCALGISTGVSAEPVPALPVQRVSGVDSQLSDWWAERISALSGFAIQARSGGAETSSELLRLVCTAAISNDAKRLHAALVDAGPAVGLGLAAVSPPLLRFLATELAGHPPRLEDLARVRRAALPIATEVLPELTPDPAEEIVARVCHAAPDRKASAPNHPADVAVAAALLVAGMLRTMGKTPDDLAQLEQHQRAAEARAAERARSHRAELRITSSARRSAVDELRPAN